MVVDRHPAADPAVRGMQRAQPRQFARAAHPLTQPVQPQRQQNPGVGRVAPCAPLARLDRLLETPQRQPFQHPPNGPCRMLRFEQPLKIGRMQNQLLTIGFAQPHRLFHHRTSTTPPLYHPYSTTLLRSLRLKNSQTLRVPRVESRLFFRPLHASVKSCHCGFSDSIERKVPCTEEKDRDSTRGTRRMIE